MLEYTYEDAKNLLTTNLDNARGKLAQAAGDLVVVRDQIVITEVNIARVYNFNVRKRREVKFDCILGRVRVLIATHLRVLSPNNRIRLPGVHLLSLRIRRLSDGQLSRCGVGFE